MTDTPAIPSLPALPIDALLPEILASLGRHANLVIEAPPGAGKTTRVPRALLDVVRGDVVVLEPRRIAARMAARRVAWELGEKAGERVGYQVRFEEVVGPRTRLRFVTEGVLTRRLLSDPVLKGVDAVVLDEFHERHLESDLALALLKRLQRTRPALKIIVMSATLDAAPVAQYLDGCPVLRSEGRSFPLTVTHMPYSPQPLEMQVAAAVELLLADASAGDMLAFLPGAAEIRRAIRACDGVARRAGLLVLPLHGDLSPAEQDRAVAPAAQRKLIVATNVAESSVTVEGVNAVIDSGLARFASHSPWTGLPTLQIGRISKASAKQRAGRAGRTGPGRVVRLYPEEDYAHRAEQETPEILRSELSQLCLMLRAMETGPLEWLDAPPAAALENAERMLDALGAKGAMIARLVRYPLAPRLSRILVEAAERGVGEDGCLAAAVLSSGSSRGKNDLLTAMEPEHDARTLQLRDQLRRMVRPARQGHHDDEALLKSVLTGFPDRVARRRTGNLVLLANGVTAEVDGERPGYEFMVALDAEDRKDKAMPLVRMLSRIEPEWLLDLYPERLREEKTLTWNRAGERVDEVDSLVYEDLVIDERVKPAEATEATAEMLARKALEAGLERFVEQELLEELAARAEFAGLAAPDAAAGLRELCAGLRSFAELRQAAGGLIPALERELGARRLQELAPMRITLTKGRTVKVHYERGKAPWIASRLQDFFGMRETPRIGPEKTPVVIHLLAPNQRAVQTTTDLAGFWERLYPTVRRELMRRYPRHAWPERPDGLA